MKGSTQTSVDWDTPLSDDPAEPEVGASLRQVAHFLDEERRLTGELRLLRIVKFCNAKGLPRDPSFRIAELLSTLEEFSARARRLPLGPVQWEIWDWVGYPVPGWVERCPRLIWRMDKVDGDIFHFRAPCDSWRCSSKCGLARAEVELLHACKMFARLPRIWCTVTTYSEGVVSLLGKRRDRAGRGGCYLVHRTDNDQLLVFSANALSKKRVEPRSGTWLSVSEALEMLIGVGLLLPGVERTSWSGGWKRKAKEPKSTGRTYDLKVHSEELMEHALAEAGAELERAQGVNAPEDFTPDDIEAIWLPMVEAAIDRQGALFKRREE